MSRFTSFSEVRRTLRGWPSRFNSFVSMVAEALGIPMDTDFSGTQVIKPVERGSPSGVATLDGDARVVQVPEASNYTPSPSSVPRATSVGIIGRDWVRYGEAGTLATVGGPAQDPRVLEAFVGSQQAPGPNVMPVADGGGKLNMGWITVNGPGDPFTLVGGKCQQMPSAASQQAGALKIPIAGQDGKISEDFIPAQSTSVVAMAILRQASSISVPAGTVVAVPMEVEYITGGLLFVNGGIVVPASSPHLFGIYKVSFSGNAVRQSGSDPRFLLSARVVHFQPGDVLGQMGIISEGIGYWSSRSSGTGVIRCSYINQWIHPTVFLDVYNAENSEAILVLQGTMSMIFLGD